MKRILAIAVLASSTAVATPLKWLCNWPEAGSQTFSLYQGETATFEPSFRVNGCIVTNLAITAVYYQTNGMGSAWWRLDNATFAPSNDVGAASYRFFVAASPPPTQNSNSNSILYRANGTLRMLHSPGFAPNVISPPIETLDFDAIEVLNPPYYTRSETEQKIVELAPTPDLSGYATKQGLAAAATAATNYTDSAIQALPDWAKASSKPTYSLNEVCPETENWLGVPGTTAAGKSIKVLAKTVNGVIEGGVTVTGSSNNDNNITKYRYGGVTATRNGTATDYLFDTASQSGIVRRSELAGLATGQGLAAAASAATNYTDSIAIDLRGEIAEAVPGDYANVSNRAARAVVHRTDDSTAVDIGQRMTGTTVGSYSLAEGYNTTASEYVAHAEGYYTTANNQCAHAEGNHTIASGVNAHAEGFYTKAQHLNEHAQGVFNDSHGDTLSSIGFGTDENDRRNAVETMKDGKTYIYGLGGYDGTNPTNSTDLAAAVNAKVSTDIFRTATNALAASTAAALALKADLAKYRAPTLTTADNWLCEWSGEVLPLRLASPIATWQKGYNAQPVLMFVKNATWQLNAVGSTILTLSSTAETAATLDFGGGYALTRLGPLESSVVYSDELDRAIASAEPGNYATVSNKAMTALQSYTETDPTISSWAKAASKPTYTAAEVGAVPTSRTVNGKALSSNISLSYTDVGAASASDVAAIAATLNAENARFVSTNYNSEVHLPQAYVEAKIDGNWLTIWREMTRWNWLFDTYLPTNYYTRAQLDALLDDKADRAWGYYDSHTGLYAPEGYTWISSPKIAIAGDLAYSRTVTSEGAIWVLESNGLVTEVGGVVSNGFFRISDDEGNALFEIVKGDKRTVGAQAGSAQIIGAFSPTKLQIGYAVIADAHPTLQIKASLTNPDWHAEDDASCPANVTWSGSSGNYVATVQAKSSSATKLYIKAEYKVGGETYIKNTAPISAQGGILCTDGIHKVRPVYTNGTITWEVVQ